MPLFERAIMFTDIHHGNKSNSQVFNEEKLRKEGREKRKAKKVVFVKLAWEGNQKQWTI